MSERDHEISTNKAGTYIDENGSIYGVTPTGYVLRRGDNPHFNPRPDTYSKTETEPSLDFESDSYIHVGGHTVPVDSRIIAQIRRQQSKGGSPLAPKRKQ